VFCELGYPFLEAHIFPEVFSPPLGGIFIFWGNYQGGTIFFFHNKGCLNKKVIGVVVKTFKKDFGESFFSRRRGG